MRFSVWLEKRDDSHFLFGIPDGLEDWHHLHDIKQLFIKYRSASRCIMIEGTTSRNTFQITAFIHSDTEFGGMSKISGPLIHSIADTLDMSLVEELTIQETAYHRPPLTFTRDAWTHLLEKMPLLKKLHIRWGRTSNGGCCREILSALTTPHIDTGALLCPVLERFTLRYDKSWSSLQFHRLAQERSSRKQPLKWLSVRSSHYQDVENIEDTDLDMLREVVEIVDLEPPLIESAVFPTVEW
ncbi:hypothetical protein A0H81_10777 [Grifola frondosa]|uniref:Uncharacterized protein n=1 Tax=Grifola frondosa TaxID=5627 RepID=A0A1C7LZ01_GRIFR|nr:hypothetical protein A0H81_10777 [Grifola frondosa]